MPRSPRLSPYGLVALLAGAVISTATTCGPPDRVIDGVVPDTGGGWTDRPREPDVGFTVIADGAADLRGEGDVVEKIVRITLSERCLTEVPEYSWGYPTGWIVFAYELGVVAGDTGGDSGGGDSGDDTAGDDTAGDDTAADDTGGGDTDTGAPVDTSAPEDTGAPTDTADRDTGWGDTGGAPPDARVLVEVLKPDGGLLGVERVRLFGEAITRDSISTERPYVTCTRDATCELAFTMRFTLAEGAAAHADLDTHVRLNMCSSGDPRESDLSVGFE